MAVLEELSAYLVSASTAFKAGGSTGTKVPIFLGSLPPDQADTAISIYEYGGIFPLVTMGSTTAAVRRPAVQVLSRSTTYTTARSNAETIYRILVGVAEVDFPSTFGSTSTIRYHVASPNQEPLDLGRDAEDREMISCNYTLQKAGP